MSWVVVDSSSVRHTRPCKFDPIDGADESRVCNKLQVLTNSSRWEPPVGVIPPRVYLSAPLPQKEPVPLLTYLFYDRVSSVKGCTSLLPAFNYYWSTEGGNSCLADGLGGVPTVVLTSVTIDFPSMFFCSRVCRTLHVLPSLTPRGEPLPVLFVLLTPRRPIPPFLLYSHSRAPFPAHTTGRVRTLRRRRG